MGFIELADVAYALPGGWTLFEGVSFRVPEGEHAGLVGANGIGKSTLLRLIVGDDRPTAGSIQTDGRVGLMRQFIGSDARPTTVRDFLLAYAEPRVSEAAIRVAKAERWMRDHPGEEAQMRYADALANWGEAGGYEAEVLFDRCTHAAFGQGYPECAERKIETLSGGERKRLALEVILRSQVRHRDARRARQRARHRGQAVARGRDRGQPQDRPVREPRPDRARPRRDQDRHARGAGRVDAPRRLLELRGGARRPGRPARPGSPALRGRAPAALGHGEGDAAQVRVQRQLGLEGSVGAAPARPVRGAREAAREGRGAERPDAHRGRTHGQGRAPGHRALDRRDRRAVRRRGLVRRADRGDRPQRDRQDALHAAAGGRGDRARGRMEARGAGRARPVRAAARARRRRRSADRRGAPQAGDDDDRVDGGAAPLRDRPGRPEPVRAPVRRPAGDGSSSC